CARKPRGSRRSPWCSRAGATWGDAAAQCQRTERRSVLAHRIEDAESGLRIVEMLRGTAEDVEQLAALRLAETAALRQVLQDHYEAGLVRVAVRLQVLQTVVQLVQVLAGV